MFRLTDDAGREVEGTVIRGFNSRLADRIASFECSYPGVRQCLSPLAQGTS